MYDMYYLNFISPIPRELLEMIASAAVESNSTQQIAKVMTGKINCTFSSPTSDFLHLQVYDQYGNFISLDEDLFVLKKKANELSYFG